MGQDYLFTRPSPGTNPTTYYDVPFLTPARRSRSCVKVKSRIRGWGGRCFLETRRLKKSVSPWLQDFDWGPEYTEWLRKCFLLVFIIVNCLLYGSRHFPVKVHGMYIVQYLSWCTITTFCTGFFFWKNVTVVTVTLKSRCQVWRYFFSINFPRESCCLL